MKRQGSFTQGTGRKLKRTSRYRVSRATLLQRQVQNTEETKYVETYGTLQAVSNTGTLACINQIAEGSDFNQRIGRNVRHKYVQFDIFAEPAAAVQTMVTWHLVLDRQPNGAVPAITAVFDNSAISLPFAFKNIGTNQNRFRILKSWTQVLPSTAASSDPSGKSRLRGTLLLQGLRTQDDIVRFPGSAAAVPNTNALYFIAISDQASTMPTVGWALRVVYTDM